MPPVAKPLTPDAPFAWPERADLVHETRPHAVVTAPTHYEGVEAVTEAVKDGLYMAEKINAVSKVSVTVGGERRCIVLIDLQGVKL